MLKGLFYRDSPENIEDKVNQSFHLFRDLVIIISGRDVEQEVLDAFYEKAEKVYQTAREIVDLQSSGNDMNYAIAHVKAGDALHLSLFEAVRDYTPGVTDPILEKIYDQLCDNHTFVMARAQARRWDLSLINTHTSLDVISEGIDCHKNRRDREFHSKYKRLLPDYNE